MAASKSSRPPERGTRLPKLNPGEIEHPSTDVSARMSPRRPAHQRPSERKMGVSGESGPPSEPLTVRDLPHAPDSGKLVSLAEEEEGTNTDRTALIADLSVRKSDRPALTVLTGLSAGQVILLDRRSLTIGRGRDVDVVLRDVGVSRRHARIDRVAGSGYVLEDLGSTNGLRVNGVHVERCELRAGDRIQVGSDVVLQFAFLDDAEENLTKQLYVAATRDALTQALNRRALDERLIAEISYARRHSTRLSVVVFDIDHFKKVNDTHGHIAGDVVLREVAHVVRRTIRNEDVFARYGGEEFVILVRGETTDQTALLGERIRRAVAGLEIRATANAVVRVTVSAGVAELGECGPAEGGEALVGLADKRLYRAKAEGRDRVVRT